MDEIYVQGESIADLPITDPIHKPCPDMAGTANFDPEKTKRSSYLVTKLREKHGLCSKAKPKPRPLTFCGKGNSRHDIRM